MADTQHARFQCERNVMMCTVLQTETKLLCGGKALDSQASGLSQELHSGQAMYQPGASTIGH